MKTINTLIAVVAIMVFPKVSFSGETQNWIEANCKSTDAISGPETSAAVVRDSLKECSEVLKQWSEIKALQAKIQQSERELGSPTQSKATSDRRGYGSKVDSTQNKSKAYTDSNAAFLLSAGGFEGSMSAKIFYKGAIHTLRLGDTIASAKVIKIFSDSVVLQQKGKRVVLTTKTFDEIDVALGVYTSDGGKTPEKGVAILTPQGIRGQVFGG